ncbi:MAG TPA: A/G-specific adenine glycosylase [Clostridiales bacterium]|nr:A/G-specific adenine glycosylase [Clostridiales bacterium]HQK72225.1 A/G-specific adenine glycosylase [Clostridiales bacterium]
MNTEAFREQLMNWYRQEARDLPWRRDPSPYKVWISEIMLQQTRVDTVIPYFDRFVAEIPDVAALARVDTDKLLKLWQGLGYYGRALRLKEAAQIMVRDFGGEVPSGVKALASLPGIGAYTAGAIASIAFGERVPAVDGNVLRVIARLAADRGDIGEPDTRRRFTLLVTQMLPAEKAGDFNQALMDLGATVCLPNGEPRCGLCPARNSCEAFRQGLTAEIPVTTQQKKRRIEDITVFVISCDGRFALRKRDDKGLLPNLWEFPNTEGRLNAEAAAAFARSLGVTPIEVYELPEARHIFTHLEWRMKGYFIRAAQCGAGEPPVWATADEISRSYSIPTALKTYEAFCRNPTAGAGKDLRQSERGEPS